MIFEDQNKCLELAKKILEHYREKLGADCHLRLLQLSENITYLAEHTENKDFVPKKAVLRLCRPGYHSEEELQAEAAWMCRLHTDTLTKQLTIRQVIPGDDGDCLHAVEDADGQTYYGMVFTYLSGKPLEDLPSEQQPIWFERLGEITALLHRQARAWENKNYPGVNLQMSEAESQGGKIRGRLPRFHWDYETMIGENAVWGDWRKVTEVSENATGSDDKQRKRTLNILCRADEMIRDRLQTYGMTEDNYGLIHGDLRGANLLTEGADLKIIDFDDCGYGWFMQDLAAALSFIETKEIVPVLIRAWLKGYQKQGVLTRADKDMLPTFIMMRRMQLLPWVHSRSNAASAIRYRKQFTEDTAALARRYVEG